MFSSVAIIIFGQLDSFKNFWHVLNNYLNTALGNWDISIYQGNSYQNVELTNLYNVGMIYHGFFLLVNLILFLNFVIAILSSTYAYYENKQLGLFNEVIVSLFPQMEFHEQYGALICA